MKRSTQNSYDIFRQAFWVGFLIILCAFGTVSIRYVGRLAYYQTRMYPGISLQGVAVEGMQLEKARQVLAERIDAFSSRLALTDGTTNHQTSLQSLGISVLLDDALSSVYAVGHTGTVWQRLRAVEGGKKRPHAIALQLVFDDATLAAYLQEQFGKTLERPAKSALVTFDGAEAQMTSAQEGVIIDRTALKKDVRERFEKLFESPKPITLATMPDAPRFTTRDAEKLKEHIEGILVRSPYMLFGNRQRLVFSKDLIASWLTITQKDGVPSIAFTQEKIREYLITVAPALNREARDAQLTFDTDGASRTEIPSEDALRLNVEKTAQALVAAITQGERSSSAVFDATPARISETFLRELGITALLGRGQTNFSGSPKNRIHNLTVASEKYRGVLVRRGEEFSFNTYLGEIDASSGYKPELVIKNNKLIAEYGGGICQVSTTLFQAAFRAGMRITERYQHSIPVRYYNPQGFDATVYPPSPDFKFVNTATGTIFIQPRIEDAKLAFEIYGQPQTHTVVIEGPKILSAKPDGSLKTVVTQKILSGSEIVYQKSFWSSYRSPSLYAVERNPLE